MFTDRRANSRQSSRPRQPWPKDKPYRILSLDGGGIKGIFTAELLRRCENEFCEQSSIRQYFDCIAGTSTGGIIALGLSVDMSAAEIAEFYFEDGRKIFPRLPARKFGKLQRILLGSLWRPRLKYEELERAVRFRFGDRLLGEARTRLVIPAFLMPETEIAVFKTDHHADFQNDHKSPMWKVARATSAAPTYLKGLEDDASGKIFLDGGLWANNPVMVALVDALSSYDLELEQVEILSIGTGNSPFNLTKSEIFGGIIAWKEALQAAMFLTTDNATAQAKLLLGPQNCLRIEPSFVDAIIQMDDYDSACAQLPKAAQLAFETHNADLSGFFESIVPPREHHYST